MEVFPVPNSAMKIIRFFDSSWKMVYCGKVKNILLKWIFSVVFLVKFEQIISVFSSACWMTSPVKTKRNIVAHSISKHSKSHQSRQLWLHLVEWSLPIQEVCSSNSVISKNLYWTFTVNCIEKTKIKKKRPRMAYNLKILRLKFTSKIVHTKVKK